MGLIQSEGQQATEVSDENARLALSRCVACGSEFDVRAAEEVTGLAKPLGLVLDAAYRCPHCGALNEWW